MALWPIAAKHGQLSAMFAWHRVFARPEQRPTAVSIRVPLRPSDPHKTSAAARWAPLARFIDAEARVGYWAGKRPATAYPYEFLRFGLKQGWACLFGGAMVALIVGTHLWYPRGAALARYDFLFLAAVAIQIGMLAFRLETLEEAKVILLFHVVGTVMEIFKTDVGSWIWHKHRCMPLLLDLFLVALFVWIAENLGTLTKTWLYPHQMMGWSAVSLGKLGSWFLLLIISYALVAAVNRPERMDDMTEGPCDRPTRRDVRGVIRMLA